MDDTTLLWIALLSFYPVANSTQPRMDACYVRARTREEAVALISGHKSWAVPDWKPSTKVAILYVKSFAEFVATRSVGFDRTAVVAPAIVVADAPARRRR